MSDEALTLACRFWMVPVTVSTVTVKEHDAALPAPSVTVYETDVVPIGKTEPLAGPPLRAVVAGQLSTPTGSVQIATAPLGHVGSRIMFAGHVIVGGVLSATVTSCVADAELSSTSVAE